LWFVSPDPSFSIGNLISIPLQQANCDSSEFDSEEANYEDSDLGPGWQIYVGRDVGDDFAESTVETLLKRSTSVGGGWIVSARLHHHLSRSVIDLGSISVSQVIFVRSAPQSRPPALPLRRMSSMSIFNACSESPPTYPPFAPAEDRKWRHVFCLLAGTSFRVHKSHAHLSEVGVFGRLYQKVVDAQLMERTQVESRRRRAWNLQHRYATSSPSASTYRIV
jgi:hypothetical protein